MLKTLDVEDAPQLPKNKDNSPPGRGSKQEKKQRALGQSSTRSADRPASDASSRRARHRKKPKVSTRNRNAGPRPARGARPAAGGRPRLQQVPAARAREAPAPDAEARGQGLRQGQRRAADGPPHARRPLRRRRRPRRPARRAGARWPRARALRRARGPADAPRRAAPPAVGCSE